MFGDTAFFPESILDGPTPSASSPETTATFLSGGSVAVAAFDSWGAIQIPTLAESATTPAGDPCIRTILQFLKAFVCTDKNATAAWFPVFPGQPPINGIFQHDPSQVVFNTRDLPALYMWRESATHEWQGEDWLRETTQVKALWVFPLQGVQDLQRLRAPFVNALIKTIVVGIERGRTPSFIAPGDTDPQAATQGSLFYSLAGFEAFSLKSWKTAKLSVQGIDGSSVSYTGVEMTFEMYENLVYGLGRFPENDGAFVTISNEAGVVTDAGPLTH